MRTRIMTALGLAAVLVGVLLLGPAWMARALFGLFIAGGAWEWSAFLAGAPRVARLCFVLLVALLAICARLLLADTAGFALLMELAVGWWVLALLWLLAVPRRAGGAWVALAGVLALVPAWVALTRMVELWPRGAQWALFVLALAFAADTGAYFAGSAFGRVKLAPQVSPGKTWEGVVGGMVLAAAACASPAVAGSGWRRSSSFRCAWRPPPFPWSAISPRACSSAPAA